MVAAAKPPDDAERHQRQYGQAGAFMDIHAPHIDRHDADDDRRRQPPVKQAQGQVPDNQATILLWIICFRCHSKPSRSGAGA